MGRHQFRLRFGHDLHHLGRAGANVPGVRRRGLIGGEVDALQQDVGAPFLQHSLSQGLAQGRGDGAFVGGELGECENGFTHCLI